MLIRFWNREALIQWDFIEQRCTVSVKVYYEQFELYRRALVFLDHFVAGQCSSSCCSTNSSQIPRNGTGVARAPALLAGLVRLSLIQVSGASFAQWKIRQYPSNSHEFYWVFPIRILEPQLLIYCSSLYKTFRYRDMDFQYHVLYTHSPYQSPHKQRSHSFVVVASTYLQFGPGTGNAYTVLYVHKHHAYVTSLSVYKYTLLPKVKIIYSCNQCTFVRQEQSLYNPYLTARYFKQRSATIDLLEKWLIDWLIVLILLLINNWIWIDVSLQSQNFCTSLM